MQQLSEAGHNCEDHGLLAQGADRLWAAADLVRCAVCTGDQVATGHKQGASGPVHADDALQSSLRGAAHSNERYTCV